MGTGVATRRLAVGVLAVLSLAGAARAADAPAALKIRILSSRPDMVSGGDALVEVRGAAKGVTLALNGKDVTGDLRLDPASHTLRGLVSGLTVGKNTLSASAGAAKASLTLTDYPITGPILSGPHISPYECRTEESGLGKPLDKDCSAAERTDYFYRSTDGKFKPLANVTDRPADLATTTTTDGATVPYVVRVESGTVNRSIYRIAMLADPKGWNHRLAVSFGGGAGAKYNQGINDAQAPLSDLFLSRGFAHAVATELVNNLHGNAVLQGETLMMLKEHFIKEHGVPKWTVGFGGSGGAIQQLTITQMYPGLARRPAAVAVVPGSDPAHRRLRRAAEILEVGRRQGLEPGEEDRGRRLHARHLPRLGGLVRAGLQFRQQAGLRLEGPDLGLGQADQSQGRPLRAR